LKEKLVWGLLILATPLLIACQPAHPTGDMSMSRSNKNIQSVQLHFATFAKSKSGAT
jgi:hypothetical protein